MCILLYAETNNGFCIFILCTVAEDISMQVESDMLVNIDIRGDALNDW